ncbi:glycoside hydrolase family 11 protein [Sorangium sp. So ce1097]|uniref:glycoside hydrolase family 11 protein n=1 Tax=Sorangium sp. So ce1097 TaxID=3133330 RepID=UPI003F60630F
MVAINSGSNSSSTNDGVEYQADKYASGGTTNSTQDSVVGGQLYQTERYGSFSYEVPVTANGNYTVKLHFAELAHNSAGSRSFSVAIEGNTVISDLDIYSEVGHDVGHTETFADIAVNDGSVTIELINGVENPTIAGFAIYSNDGELDTTTTPDPGPDFSKYSAYTQKYTEKTVITSNHATGHVGDYFFTHWKDGGSTSLTVDPNGEFSVTWQGGGYNYVGGPGWHYGDENRVIGYRFNNDSGASYITLYGWGYDKNMPTSNPAHLVEYYILQRWSYDPSQGATRGKSFMSNGVEYTTYRSTRQQQPSINGRSTFYQYWSKPAQQQALGQDHKIIFADHVKAWADTDWIIPNMNNLDASDDPTYQVMAVEVFNPGSNGTASGRVWDETP